MNKLTYPAKENAVQEKINEIIDNTADIDLSNLSATGTKVIDGQWIRSYLEIASGVSIPANQTTDPYDLSSYLPNDNYQYEVMLTMKTTTGSASGSTAVANVFSDIFDGTSSNRDTSALVLSCTNTRTSSTHLGGSSGTIPVGTGRYVKITSTSGVAYTVNSFIAHAYRRIGTNT